MLFSSLTFIYIFLPILGFLYFIIQNPIYRRIILTIFSVLFYAWGEPIFVLLILGSVFVNFISGLFINKAENKPILRKTYLVSSVTLNLAILAIFKYTPMAIETVNTVFETSFHIPDITMPIGISFYTFQAMSYVIDVYRKDTEAQRSYFDLLLYITLFPQLIAGPIVRYKDIVRQIPQRKDDVEKINQGIFRFCIGLAKKVIIANNCGSVCKALLDNIENRAVSGLWIGMIFFSLQIYFDFSGYSDMAIGLGKIFGFEFKENFNYPYLSKSATEFWRRWHMSLGTWFRDYVYIPLGGNRVSKLRWFFNFFVVWFLTGFWHGAAWNFIIWGLFFAVLLIAEKVFLLKYLNKSKVLSRIYTLVAVGISFVIFNATDMKEAASYIGGMFGAGDAPLASTEFFYYLKSFAVTLVIGIIGATPIVKKVVEKVFENTKASKFIWISEPVGLIVLLAVMTAYLVDGSFNPFLYFRF